MVIQVTYEFFAMLRSENFLKMASDVQGYEL